MGVDKLTNSRLVANGAAALTCSIQLLSENGDHIEKTHKWFICFYFRCARDNIIKTSLPKNFGFASGLKQGLGEELIHKVSSRHGANDVAPHLFAHV
jgi:hypothetical protein